MLNYPRFTKKIYRWLYQNIITIILVLTFILIHAASQNAEDVFLYFGATGMQYLNGEYYRWLTSLFLHYNIGHLLANSAALLSVGSLITPLLKQRQSFILFLTGGVLAEIAFSVVVSDQIYDIGASSGIFALIACFIACCLRFPEDIRPVWYRPDALIVFVYFFFANTSVSAFLVHTFGFAAGILISFVMILTGRIKNS
ncbi:MAG: rhomboid family intramembrane serine protease [Clostridiales bacterium]|nr:rhomboid family intramembrane serine protease [Clostridiales bacterium]